jgi:glycosyltransferase involved in cell wall biosynthesis
MQTISAYILTYNEAEKLKAAAESVLWADEIVVDSCSADATAQIATELGARVVQVPFKGFGDLRNSAMSSTTFLNSALSTAGPVSSSPSAISKGRIIATLSATSRHKIGHRRRASRYGEKQKSSTVAPR